MQTRLHCAVTFVAFATLSMFASNAFGQWTGKVILGETTVAQPALATFQGRLYLAWNGTDTYNRVNVMSSADGLNYDYSTKRTLDSTLAFGPGLSAVPSCGVLLLATAAGPNQYSRSVYTYRSYDGLNWDAPFGVLNQPNSTPVLDGQYGNYGAVAYKDSSGNILLEDFTDCGYHAVADCFYVSGGSCQDAYTGINDSPGFDGPYGVGRQAFSLYSNNRIKTGNTTYGWADLFGNSSQNGPSVAYDPVSGNVYVAWTGASGGLNIMNVFTGAQVISNDWSNITPAIAVFQGQVFVAWRGGGNAVNVAKLNLF
jgi:hypothetical protein